MINYDLYPAGSLLWSEVFQVTICSCHLESSKAWCTGGKAFKVPHVHVIAMGLCCGCDSCDNCGDGGDESEGCNDIIAECC